MIAYTGYPGYEYIVKNGMNPGPGYCMWIGWKDGAFEVLSSHDQRAADNSELQPVILNGNGIDGDGVFHGTPRKPLSEIDFTELFGPYPKSLVKEKPLEPIKNDRTTRISFVQDVGKIVYSFWDYRDLMMRFRSKQEIQDEVELQASSLARKYFS